MSQLRYVGLIPAAGRATRLGEIGHSKEVLPLDGVYHPGLQRTRIACDCLLDGFREAGIRQAYLVLRDGKWDIPQVLQDGAGHGLDLSYHMMRLPYGTPFSLAQALPFVRDCSVALGFPDIQFTPSDAFTRLIARQQTTEADIVLGLFPVADPRKFDMVDFVDNGFVRKLEIKPMESSLRYTWTLAVWNPGFSLFMQDFLAQQVADKNLENAAEIYVGTVFQAAINAGFSVQTEIMDEGKVLDIGTLDDLEKVRQFYAASPAV